MRFKRMVSDVNVAPRRPERWEAEYDSEDAHARSEYPLREGKDASSSLRSVQAP
jgi:hypothetical protein